MHKLRINIFLVLSLVLLFASSHVYANNRIDSLKTNIPSLTDSTTVDTLSTPAVDSSVVKKILTKQELREIRRDSLKAVRDSIIKATPRVLNTYAIPDSMHFKRILTWNNDAYFNDIHLNHLDSTFRDWTTEYQFMKEDINGTYLGIIGSPTEYLTYFKRKELDIFPSYAPYLPYTYTPESVPQYNTKSPYTELAYWGTLFAYKDKEELSLRFLHTQNITPAINFGVLYQRYGGVGLLQNEGTDNRSFAITLNHLGERYIANAGYISSTIKRSENGGMRDPLELENSEIEAKAYQVTLSNASNDLKKYTGFLKHSYVFPINLTKKQDTLDIRDKTQAVLGHIAEFNTYLRQYKDEISTSDKFARDFYNNQFYIHPSKSNDKMHLIHFENKFFLRLQPWSEDALLSKVEGGAAYQFLNYYNFDPNSYLYKDSYDAQNNLYVYAGASGKLKKYFSWRAFTKYVFAGYSQNDLEFNADATFAFYPFKSKTEGIYLKALFESDLKTPDWYSTHYYSNHYRFNEDFSKMTEMKVKGELSIPSWDLTAFFGYSLSSNRLYYDSLSVIKQHSEPISIMSASVEKNFKFWLLRFDNQVLFQTSSRPDIVPLPMLAARARWYLEFVVVKDAMTMQLGADATFNTAYYAPAYNPALGVFHHQEKELIGNNPYIDVFVNVQWKTASIFVKYTNTAQGWPSYDYFSAYHYIKPQRAFKFGIFWPFTIK